MTTDRTEKLTQLILRDDTYRSPGVPTRRFGVPVLISVTAGFPSSDADRTAPREPLQWIAADPDSGEILILAYTHVITPLPEWQPATMPLQTSTLAPSEAGEAMRRYWRPAVNAFLHSTSLLRPDQEQARLALDSVIPVSLQPWLYDCCSDFVAWLDPGPGAPRPR